MVAAGTGTCDGRGGWRHPAGGGTDRALSGARPRAVRSRAATAGGGGAADPDRDHAASTAAGAAAPQQLRGTAVSATTGMWSEIATEALWKELQARTTAALDEALAASREGTEGFVYLPEGGVIGGSGGSLGLGIRIGSTIAYPTAPDLWLVVRQMAPIPELGVRFDSAGIAAWRLSTEEVVRLAASFAEEV